MMVSPSKIPRGVGVMVNVSVIGQSGRFRVVLGIAKRPNGVSMSLPVLGYRRQRFVQSFGSSPLCGASLTLQIPTAIQEPGTVLHRVR